jgi:hypothetical protein
MIKKNLNKQSNKTQKTLKDEIKWKVKKSFKTCLP